MNHIGVANEHVARLHFHNHFRVGRLIGWIDQPSACTEYTGRPAWKAHAIHGGSQSGELPVECYSRYQRLRRVIEYVRVVLVIGKLVAGMQRLIDVLDSIGNRVVTE